MIAPLALPLMMLTALLVYIDSPGPIFFRQLRTGKGGRRFRMYKFRTMVPNAEELKLAYAHLNELTWPDFKITDDPRVTRIGRILRKTSLDELPQLLNVIKGDMSVVGPRPTSFSPETYRLWHTERLEVLPGITGLWQVNGRSNLDFDERLKLDIAYIERQSLWMDIQIIMRTGAQVFVGEGAY
jgi:lipopolysaccharide/colanic/teichoic acid biosynthesis glycosyltransferase